jgi:hypothetical protein
MPQSAEDKTDDSELQPISILSTGPIGLEPAKLPLRLVAQMLALTASAVLLVHLFLPAELSVFELVAHVVALSVIYTLAFVAAYVALAAVWPRRPRWFPARAFIWAVSLLGAAIGLGLAKAIVTASAVLGGAVHAHEGSGLMVRLIPVWAILVGLLVQNEKLRLLTLELGKNSALRREANGGQSEPGEQSLDALHLTSGRAQFVLRPEQIAYVAAEENYCSIHFLDEASRAPLLLRTTFALLIDQLPAELFVPIHRSYVVNVRCVTRVETSAAARAVVLSNGSRLPISRARLNEVQERFARAPEPGSATLDRPLHPT